MILNTNYDSSLWLMMNGHKKVKNQIIEFFNGFPEELLIQMRRSIKKYEEYFDKDVLFEDIDWYKENLCGSFEKESGIVYCYQIDKTGRIELVEGFNNGEKIINLSYISLNRFDKIYNVKKADLGAVAIGITFIDDVLYVPVNFSTEVFLIDLPLGINVVSSYGHLSNFKKSLNRVNMKGIPEDYSLDDIKNVQKSKKLVRKKKSNMF